MRYKIVFFIAVLLSFQSFGQNEVKRNLYKGNTLYKNNKFKDAESFYNKALELSRYNFIGNFNLGNTYFKLEDFENALETYEFIKQYCPTNIDKAKLYHNIGNTFMFLNKLEDAIEAYKEGLRLNPYDEETRYNLAYALEMKKQQDQDKQQNQDKQDNQDNQDGQENQENQNDQNEDNNDSNENDSSTDGNDKKENESSQNNQDESKQEGKISKEQALRILEAANKKEKEIQAKIDKGEIKKSEGTEKKKIDW